MSFNEKVNKVVLLYIRGLADYDTCINTISNMADYDKIHIDDVELLFDETLSSL